MTQTLTLAEETAPHLQSEESSTVNDVALPSGHSESAGELESIKALLRTPLPPEKIARQQTSLQELERLFDELNEQAEGEAVIHTSESLRDTIAATYEERENEQL